MFQEDLPGLLPESEIDFGSDLLPVTQSILIPPWKKAPTELKKMK